MTKRSISVSSSSSTASSSSSSSSSCHHQRQVPRHYVVHDYHDYAHEPDDPAKAPIRRRKGGVNIPFPIVLHRTIARVEADGLGHIFGWQPHGRAFLIHKPRQFVEIILPMYFKQSKLTSFQRQLNLYGFNRLTRGPDASGYYHEYFLRHREFLAKRMMRQRIKGTKIKGAASPDAEPDFYAMPTVGLTIDPSLATSNVSSSSMNFHHKNRLYVNPPTAEGTAVSQEPPIVSSDDMSHDSSSSSGDDEVSVAEDYHSNNNNDDIALEDTSSSTIVDEHDIEMVLSAEMAPLTTTTTTTTASVPSASYLEVDDAMLRQDYASNTPVLVSSTSLVSFYQDEDQDSQQIVEDPADALLMDLHSIDPLEDFVFPAKTTDDFGLGSLLHQTLDELV